MMEMMNNMFPMMAGYDFLGIVTQVLIIALLVLLIVWIIKQIKK